MSTAQRYDPLTDQSGHLKCLTQVPDGAFVLYSDHARVVASLEAQKARLLGALERLDSAAECFAASQDGATDWRVGLVQPINVAEGQELVDALAAARAAIAASKEDK